MKDKYNIDDSTDYLFSVSAHDCTGLIPANNVEITDNDAYKDIYDYEPPFVVADKYT